MPKRNSRVFRLATFGLLIVWVFFLGSGGVRSAPSIPEAVYGSTAGGDRSASVVEAGYDGAGSTVGEVYPDHPEPSSVAREAYPEGVVSVVYGVYTCVLVVEGESPVRVLRAIREIAREYPQVRFVARSDPQALEDPELEELVASSDLIYLNRVSPGLGERMAGLLGGKRVIVFDSEPWLVRLSTIGSFDFEDAQNAIEEIAGAREAGTVAGLVYRYPRLAPYLQAKQYVLRDTGGFENLKNMFLYLLHQTVPSVVYAAYQVVPEQFIYYRGSIYPDLASYLPLMAPGRPVVGVLAWAPQTYQIDDLALLDRLIDQLEQKGLSVICLMTREREGLAVREFFANAEAVINLLPFDLPETAAEALKTLGVPVFKPRLAPFSSGAPKAEEQGQIEPLLVAGPETRKDEQTGLVYNQMVPADGCLEHLAERVWRWVRLRKLPDDEKRIALVFYNSPPGKQNISARHLAVPDSILGILTLLKDNGYGVEDLPATPDELLGRLYERGINVGPWTPGKLKDLAKKAVLVPAEEYRDYFEKLPPVVQKEVVEGPFGYLEEVARLARAGNEREIIKEIARWQRQMESVLEGHPEALGLVREAAETVAQMVYRGSGETVAGEVYALRERFARLKADFLALGLPGLTGWGEPPGAQMTAEIEGKRYLVIPGLWCGNVFVAPQPLRGLDDTDMLYHSPVLPPPHQYLAFYAWLDKNFDAVIHLGCHGSYEWLPGREFLFGCPGYPELVIGGLPSIYLYLADDAGESALARRRGLAVTVGHLVPPLERAGLYGDLERLAQLLEEDSLDLQRIKDLARRLHLEREDDVQWLTGYLRSLQELLVPNGLHVYGRDWDQQRLVADGLTAVPGLPELLARARNLDYRRADPGLRAEIDGLVRALALQILEGRAPAELVAELAVDKAVYTGLDEVLAAELNAVLGRLAEHFRNVRESFRAEQERLLEALDGRYVPPGPAGNHLQSPASMPTGRNLYSANEAFLPIREAYRRGSALAEQVLAHNPPRKVAVLLRTGDDGLSLAFGLRLLGVEPVWDENGVVGGVYAADLAAPRVDVLFMTGAGFPESVSLVDRAVRLVLARSYRTIAEGYPDLVPALDGALAGVSREVYGDEPLEQNFPAKHWVAMTAQLIARGVPAEEAGKAALARVFCPPPRVYENRLPAAVHKTGTWSGPERLADLYVQNFCSAYGEGYTDAGLFREHLKGLGAIYYPETSLLYGVLDTELAFANAGGLALAARCTRGEEPPVYVATPSCRVEGLAGFLEKELRARYFNPQWIRGMMAFDFSGAKAIEGFVFDFFGWQAVSRQAIRNWMWDELKAIYIDDKYGIGVAGWLQSGNNAYAMIGILGLMMVAAKKGFWQADEETLKQLAELWAKLIIQMEPALCPVCEDLDLLQWALGYIDPSLLEELLKRIGQVTERKIEVPGPQPPRPSGGSQPKPVEMPKPVEIPQEPELLQIPKVEWRLTWEAPDLLPPAAEEVPSQPLPPAEPAAEGRQVPTAPSVEAASRTPPQVAPAEEGPGEARRITAYEVEERKPGGRGHIPVLALVGVAAMVFLGLAGFLLERRKR
ncbi:MAG: cobaltochelatase subunit CobN [Desulfotomaculales bacterium]